ncbi:uncharacterized protein LOC119070985 [Bradysia coprophila]|uniref:uncharacterized protein LOC119070985 n=1 Tax=Bradysia coprophila TaxID=38358 RepID=UPI00187D85ED|nr:uncharacterized protein LOC119070985 [Bradysia coprophila]
MNLKEFIVVVVLVLNKKWSVGLSHTDSNELRAEIGEFEITSNGKSFDVDGILRWTEVGRDLLKAAISTDSETIITVAKTLSNAIPYIGDIMNMLIDIMSSSNGYEEIKYEFQKMDSHLFAIENKIDALSQHVTATSILSYYKSQAQVINVIQKSYERYLHTNTPINMLELIDNCKRNKIINFIYYVHAELTDSTTLPLMTVMKDDNNLRNFQLWMKMLIGSMSQSMMLHSICMSVQYLNDTSFNETIDGDISYLKNVSDIMLKVVKDGTNDIKRDFFETAKTEILSYAYANQVMNHSKFSNKVWHKLVKKYFWRHWFVLSYDMERVGAGNHWVAFAGKYVYAWFRTSNRNLNVVNTNNNDYSIEEKLNTCMEKKEWSIVEVTEHGSDMCEWVYDYLDDCIGNVNGKAVINFQTEYSADWSEGIAARYSVYSPRAQGFNVFAVAPEK